MDHLFFFSHGPIDNFRIYLKISFGENYADSFSHYDVFSVLGTYVQFFGT